MPPPKKQAGKPSGGKSKDAPEKPTGEPAKASSNGKRNGIGKKTADERSKEPATSPTGEVQAPKNDVRTTVSGSSSWTGKLPMNLWSEYCQKQKWQKPEYGMRKVGTGFLSWVFVKRTNPKNMETTETTLRIPSPHDQVLIRPTAAEARHLAATYALFRVASTKNYHMMLPPNIRDVWKELQTIKEADLKAGIQWLYRDDPFLAKQEHDADAEAKKQSREKRANQKQADKAKDGVTAIPLALRDTATNNAGWAHAPIIEIGKKRRLEVEATIRRFAKWNPYGDLIPGNRRQAIIDEMTKAGFRQAHVKEAVELCKDRDECLEWLLIHVPEDDLPSWSFPKDYHIGVTFASNDLERENALALLSEGGYPKATCATSLDQHGGDVLAAAAAMQAGLVQRDFKSDATRPEDDGSSSVWEEEMETLDAIFGPRFKQQGLSSCSIEFDIEGSPYSLRASKSKNYPQEPPIIAIHGGMPAYIKLQIYQKALRNAQDSFIGEPMIYNIVDWIEASAKSIIANPGSLKEISAVTTGLSQEQFVSTARSSQHRRFHRKQLAQNKQNDLAILDEYHKRQKQQNFKDMQRKRESLPAWACRQNIISTVRNNQVTIISGETGSGKSTQVVQFVLDDMVEAEQGSRTNIVCTQPRRIAAIGLADRVSAERCSGVGEEVGYSIRGESKQKPGRTKISFVTTGVLLRRFQGSGDSKDYLQDALTDISHVFVDEVHERDLDTDFLLILLRNVITARKDLKIVLMSATIDAAVFENYFKAAASVGKANIPGRTFDIQDHYLEDALKLSGYQQDPNSRSLGPTRGRDHRLNYELIGATVAAIHGSLPSSEGGILIFLPGVAEINRTIDELRRVSGLHVLPLHAALTPSEQRSVFRPPPGGKRKVVVATNIAETSITVEDIVVVVDSGKVKQTSYDPNSHMVRLEECLISKAAAMQRRGRAGRVRAGECYKLYTREVELGMAPRPDPEILRTPLEQLFLMTRAMGVADVHNFLGKALTPPSVAALDKAESLLRSMGAIDGNHLTALGQHLAQIPADLRLGKLLIYGSLFGCLNHCLNIAAILAARSPFLAAREVQANSKQARAQFAEGNGDLIGDMRAFEEWLKRRKGTSPADLRQWVASSYLSYQSLQDILSNKTQLLSSLRDTGFLSSSQPDDLQRGIVSMALLRAVVAGSFHPQVARIQFPDKKYTSTISGAMEMDPEARSIKHFVRDAGRVFIHPSSTLFDAQGYVGDSVYMSYFASLATAKTFIKELTPFNAYSLALFCGTVAPDIQGRGLVVDGWLKLQGWARIGVLSSRLRALLDDILGRHFDNPGSISDSEESNQVLKCVSGLLLYNGLDE